MINILNYNLNSDYEDNKKKLEQLDNYLAFTEDNQMLHLKPIPNIFYVTTNNSGTTIYKNTGYQNGYEKITLENGENKFTNWYYGFYFADSERQDRITSFDFSKYDTSNVTSMGNMFNGCRGLTSLDLSKFDTSKVTNMYHMFKGCYKLAPLDVSNFDTSKVNSMNSMFYYCSGLTSLDVSNFNTSKVTNMYRMFSDCKSLTSLDLSSFNTSNVTNMYQMFYECSGLTSLDLSNFNTSKVTNMTDMFNNCSKLTHIKCKQAFKDWCITNQDTIKLPTAMVNGTVGTDSSYNWEIIDLQG